MERPVPFREFIGRVRSPSGERQHEALKRALAKGEDTGKIFERLRKEIEAHEAELRAFAGM